jgi:pimeloyl-ACP methyl ester carboxylesterase
VETVTSAGGTVFRYGRAGDGCVLIVSVGAFRIRRTFAAPCDLTRQFTVVTCDRHGRGDSGGTLPFAPEREHEDLAAVVEAAGTGLPFVYGRSCGACGLVGAIE